MGPNFVLYCCCFLEVVRTCPTNAKQNPVKPITTKQDDKKFRPIGEWCQDLGHRSELSVSFLFTCLVFSRFSVLFAFPRFRPVCESLCVQVRLCSSHPSLGAV